MNPERIYSDDVSEVWVGNCLDVECVASIMGDRKADLICLDAPYSPKTHEGHKKGKLTADRAAAFARSKIGKPSPESRYAARHYGGKKGQSDARGDLDYDAWTPAIVTDFVDLWATLNQGWWVSLTDDVLAPCWQSEFGTEKLQTFAPLPLVETGSRVRMTGDGPSNWTCWVVVARPRNRKFASWGTLQGAYIQPAERDINSKRGSVRIVGGKPLRSMRAIVGDYSRPGDLVVDPTCGGGTTLVAAKQLGRRCIGIDSSRERAEIAAKRLAVTREQKVLFPTSSASATADQTDLFRRSAS